ncbi:MAG: response regulator [Chloroflexota bacterium]|nr:response regulator [Chloroflexota bacterium]
MTRDDLVRENQALRERLSKLSEASLRVSEDLDLDTVLQEVVDGARALTQASRGGLIVVDESGELQAFVTSGVTAAQHQLMLGLPDGIRIFHYLTQTSEPLRVTDFSAHLASVGLPEIGPPLGPVTSFLGVPIRHQGQNVGTVNVADKGAGLAFTQEDEDTLRMFAAHAAMAIANAHRYREEQRARADLETLVTTAPVGVVVFDATTGTPVLLNREAVRIVDGLRNPDQSVEALLDVMIYRRADGRAVSLEESPLAQALSISETVRAEEIVLQVPDGRSVTTLVNATPIRSEAGDVESVIVTFQDMTPLEEQERLRAEFLGLVSHELRAPLTSIKGSAAAVLGASSVLDATEMHQFFRIIDGQADHMLDLISDLLDMARIEVGTLSVAREPSDLARLIDQARNTFLGSESRHTVQIDLPLDLPRVLADRRRIVQVLTNLLANAARHSPESSTIRVAAEHVDVHVAISVVDDGVGISAGRLPHLFRKSTRIEAAEPRGGIAGSGLGLAICRGIVEAHGGRIWAESDGPGRGARFTFTIPLAEEAAGALAPRLPRSAVVRRQRTRVLAVDDDPQTLRYVRDELSKLGYEVTATSDPKEALGLVREQRPHLALVDLVLPETDGIELMQEILDIANVPVIFLSAYGRDQVIAVALEMGADDYIVKPFSPTELSARIQAALRRRAAPERAVPDEPFAQGDLTIAFAERLVTVAGRPVQLTATEYDLLVELAINAGRVVTHDQLLERVWGSTDVRDVRVIRTHLTRLRRKLGEDASSPTYIFAEPRVGYRMAARAPSRADTP